MIAVKEISTERKVAKQMVVEKEICTERNAAKQWIAVKETTEGNAAKYVHI